MENDRVSCTARFAGDLEAYGRLTMAVLTLAGRPFNAQPVAAPEFAVGTRTGTVMVCDVSRQRVQEICDI